MSVQTKPPIAAGSNRNFSFTLATDAPDQIWRLWTTPASWADWDQGLKSARQEGEMALGSVGQIVPLFGLTCRFEVVKFEAGRGYGFVTHLPLATLRVDRFFNGDRSAFTHLVTFAGPMAFLFSRLFGPGFRKALPASMIALSARAGAI
ncbi:MAG: hypothetical protein AB8B51_12610 [Sedimentitalea sp.]